MVEIAETVAHLRRRATARREQAERRASVLEASLPRAREILRSHGAEAVFVFGSLASGHLRSESDLDLAVKGLPRESYFPALGELMSELPCDVDLVVWEEAPESLRERIAAEGRSL